MSNPTEPAPMTSARGFADRPCGRIFCKQYSMQGSRPGLGQCGLARVHVIGHLDEVALRGG